MSPSLPCSSIRFISCPFISVSLNSLHMSRRHFPLLPCSPFSSLVFLQFPSFPFIAMQFRSFPGTSLHIFLQLPFTCIQFPSFLLFPIISLHYPISLYVPSCSCPLTMAMLGMLSGVWTWSNKRIHKSFALKQGRMVPQDRRMVGGMGSTALYL